jgi:peptidoglycan pentaglycine glycine transferase (the first glycine)
MNKANSNSIEIKEVSSKEAWESFLLAQDLPPFMQSWNAGDLAEKMGENILRLGLYNQDKLIGVCLISVIDARRGKHLYAPYGPVIHGSSDKVSAYQALTEYLRQKGKELSCDFIRLAPYLERTDENEGMLKALGYRTSPIHVLSEIVWKLDLTLSEDELLMNMRKTTRNLIRRAIKDNVVMEKTTEDSAVSTFIELMQSTFKRHQFVPYPDKLYREQVNTFKGDDQVIVYRGKSGDEVIASAIVMYYGNVASYHHGASIRSKVPVAYLLQWEAIKEAKARGCREYSFWGIEETEDSKHPFYGITKFKKGFSGDIRYLVQAQDYPLTAKYWFNYLIETIRRIKRGFGFTRS